MCKGPNKKTVLITGCSEGGIGASLAEEFLKRGYHVFATARTVSKIPRSITDSANSTILKVDVLSASDISLAVQSVETKTNGRLDILVNNSGAGMSMPGIDCNIEEGKALFDLNVWSVLAVTQAFIPLLLKSGGYVVNNGSIAGHSQLAFMSLYNASKAAMMAASETWRLELEPFGIKVLTVTTGIIETNFHPNFKPPVLPEGSLYTPVKDLMQQRANERPDRGMSSQEYSKKLVNMIERGATGKVWLGGIAGIVKFSTSFMPYSFFDMIMRFAVPIQKPLTEAWKNKEAEK